MLNLRNAPKSIISVIAILAVGAGFNFVMGLLLALAPEVLKGIEHPDTANGAPSKLILISGVACIAIGFVFIWVLRELANKSPLAIVMIYTLSVIILLFGMFRLPIGFINIAVNLLVLSLIRSKSAKQWLSSP
jgi:undecaprenyl pyrophosphate phosphatase UppP